MLPIDPHHFDNNSCGGPSGGCRYCMELFHESPERQHERTLAEDVVRRTGIRIAAERRLAILCGDDSRNYAPPDSYAKSIAKLQAELPPPTRWPDPPTVDTSKPPSYAPVDPYTPHLKIRKESR
jgi:hypothetical protein